MTVGWQDIYRRRIIFFSPEEETPVQLILSCKHRMSVLSLCEYSMIELGVTAHKLRNFSISWNTSAQRALSLDRIGTGSNLIERQLRWLKGQHECRLRTRRSEDSRLQLFERIPLPRLAASYLSKKRTKTKTKTHLSKHSTTKFRNRIIFSIKVRRCSKARKRRVIFRKNFFGRKRSIS